MIARLDLEPTLSPDLLAAVLAKLDIVDKPALDLAGLNRLCAAYSSHVPNDNIQKRIWLSGARTRAVTGGDPVEFFTNWLDHGTGGTCFPANGALCALLQTIGFDARRISGAVLMEGIEHDGNHGTVLVNLDGVDFLVDAQLAAFSALPLVPGQFASTGTGIHDICALPVADGFDVQWYPGSNRQTPLVMRPNLQLGAVGHDYFLAQYALSASRDRRRSPFNEALFIGRHFAGSILIVGRNNRIDISADNTVIKSEITLIERNRILVEELGISEQVVDAIPADEKPGN
ncbi:arylamine N-acetyltransferase [Roseiarcaceae bacterium H3SJ34-1]|uniref:arylamine N-acetyltransferase n=1 Tax=Terripilifer ovatus TaxID=3032367 RepID=UPI003AB923B0|nr:arylamine N-acetyltransferase [Roseiarcaceae bacterium H3SJ34-1]